MWYCWNRTGFNTCKPVYLWRFNGITKHRGQDAAGICTIESNRFRLRKANGLVKDVLKQNTCSASKANVVGGHVRYPTAGSSSASEAQPFYVNSPFGITLAHNGNLTNASEVREKLFEKDRRHVNTTSDSRSSTQRIGSWDRYG